MIKRKFKNILVVVGGNSGEREVSLASGKACYKALKKKKYNVSIFDPKFKNLNLINKHETDAIFNALHGKGGEDGIAQSYFEYLKIPYTHSGVVSSYNAMNKIISKDLFIKSKILTPKYFSLTKKKCNNKTLQELVIKNIISFPCDQHLKKKELDYVISVVNRFYEKNKYLLKNQTNDSNDPNLLHQYLIKIASVNSNIRENYPYLMNFFAVLSPVFLLPLLFFIKTFLKISDTNKLFYSYSIFKLLIIVTILISMFDKNSNKGNSLQ